MLGLAPRTTRRNNNTGAPTIVPEGDQCGRSTAAGSLTREDVQEELRQLLRETLAEELQQLSEALQRDVRDALRRFGPPAGCARRHGTQLFSKQESGTGTVPEPEPSPTSVPGLYSASSWASLAGCAAAAEEARRGGTAAAMKEDCDDAAAELPAPHGGGGERAGPGIIKASTLARVAWLPPPNELGDCDRGLRRRSGGASEWRSGSTGAVGNSGNAERVKALNHKLKGKSYEMDKKFFARMSKQATSTNLAMKMRFSLWTEGEAEATNPPIRDFAAALLNSDYFDYSMGVLVFTYAILVGVQVDWEAQQNSRSSVPWYLRLLDIVFCVVFIMELSLRIFVHGKKFLRMDGWKWNAFDSTACFFAVLEECAKLLRLSSLGGGWSVLTVIRIGRLLRVARIVHVIPELKQMMYLIVASMSCFLWTLVLMLVLIYCVAVFFTERATDMKWSELELSIDEARQYWGSISSSILTLYMSISGGLDWGGCLQVFKQDSLYLLNVLVFSFYIAFATLVLLNLVTGVFVDGAQRIIRDEKDTELVRVAAKQFTMTDTDGSLELSFEELEHQLQNHGLDEYCALIGINPAEMNKLFYILDEDHSGSVSIKEFVKGCLHLRGTVKNADLASLGYNLKVLGIETNQRIASLEEMVRSLCVAQRGPDVGSPRNVVQENRKASVAFVAPLPEGLPGTIEACDDPHEEFV